MKAASGAASEPLEEGRGHERGPIGERHQPPGRGVEEELKMDARLPGARVLGIAQCDIQSPSEVTGFPALTLHLLQRHAAEVGEVMAQRLALAGGEIRGRHHPHHHRVVRVDGPGLAEIHLVAEPCLQAPQRGAERGEGPPTRVEARQEQEEAAGHGQRAHDPEGHEAEGRTGRGSVPQRGGLLPSQLQ